MMWKECTEASKGGALLQKMHSSFFRRKGIVLGCFFMLVLIVKNTETHSYLVHN